MIGAIVDDRYVAAGGAHASGPNEGSGAVPDDAEILRQADTGAIIPCPKSGYLQHVDHSALVAAARTAGALIVLRFRPGQFVLRGGDAGCQYGEGITCHGGPNKSSFPGWMLYDRAWFHKDLFAVTLGGGEMNNTGRYLTLLPPIDGAWAASGTPYFTENPANRPKCGIVRSISSTCLVGGGWLSSLRCALFRRSRWRHSSGRKQRLSPVLHLQIGCNVGHREPGSGGSGLRRRAWQCLVSGPTQ
jgi:hypothetical protein